MYRDESINHRRQSRDRLGYCERALCSRTRFLVARNPDKLKEAVNSFKGHAHGVACDLADSSQIRTLVNDAASRDFAPDVLVLNAAVFGTSERSVVKPQTDELRQLFEVNVLANYQLVQSFLETVSDGSYPRIILIGSTAGIRTDEGSLYGISKWALRSYAYSLRTELRNLGVGVTLLNPGGTFTEKRTPNEQTADDRLLEASDIGKLVAVLLTLSHQAVVEEINVRPMLGDTY